MDSDHLPNSLFPAGDHSANIIELNKKRKLPCYELENSDSPLLKHRNCDRYGSSDHPQIITNHNSMEAELIDGGIDNSLEIESENDSISFIGVSDNKITSEVDIKVENPSMSSSQDKLCAENQFEDETIEEIYSNDVAPFLLASGKCSIEQDARLGTSKPTIDQEFEQYFSALML
ncbi:uncharacterized protein A4U43_C05F3220 [Asparagus officinalis]|uniref:Uncharacterized protein n=1 Tax=Asparagus officinalis TaxID=4686 RepID=A0A5P1ERI2_ASPOF|nr:protein FAR-RED-ELONGATED HYPOCOTYL 1-LIKE [Asparagus officinalis]ONK67737.1 uncharacterized protein A4U43_C05F3220 [Asparagus officinalis]